MIRKDKKYLQMQFQLSSDGRDAYNDRVGMIYESAMINTDWRISIIADHSAFTPPHHTVVRESFNGV